MPSDSERITQIHTSAEVGEYVRQPVEAKQAEQELLARYNLRYELGTIQYNYNPIFIARHRSRDLSELVKGLRDRYDLSFEIPRELRASLTSDGHFDDDDIRAVLDGDGFTFSDGLLVYADRGDKVIRVISQLNLHQQNFNVSVVGRTGEAEFVAANVINDFVRWGQAEEAWKQFMNSVDLVRYRTIVRCSFPVPLETLVDSKLKGKLEEVADGPLGPRFGFHEKDVKARIASLPKVVPVLHEIEFAINVQSSVSGQTVDGIFDLAVTNRQHRGRGIVTSTSSLPSDDHVMLLYELIQLYE